MRILMIHPHDIHSSSEPWTRRIKSIAGEIVRKGHEVKLVYFPLSSGVKNPVVSSLGYEEIPLPRKPSPAVFISNTIRLLKLAQWADVVHFQKCHHYSAVPSVAAAFLAGKPLHYDWDDWEEMIWYESCGRKIHSRFIGISFRFLEKILPAVSDSVSVASRYLHTLAVSRGAREERIYFAPVGADVAEFNPSVDRTRVREQYAITGPLVLYIGQLHGAQYIDLFIHAAHILVPQYPDARFMIVGEGFMEGVLKRLSDELGLSGRVIFTGSVRHDLIPFYIRAADVCVAPFRDTPVTRCKSPLKIVEYMSCGKAVVASNVGEVPRMLGGAGILVKAGDVRSLADGIELLLKDPCLRKKLGEFARRRAENRYNWAQTAQTLVSAYESIYKI